MFTDFLVMISVLFAMVIIPTVLVVVIIILLGGTLDDKEDR